MKAKKLLLMALMIMLLSACAFPFAAEDTPPTSEPVPDTVEPTKEPEPTAAPTETPIPEPSPTEEPAPTATTTQPEPTMTEAASPTNAPTSEPGPPTVIPDPATALGAPDFHDPLDGARIFARKTTTCFETSFESGWMVMRALGPSGAFCWQLASTGLIGDFYMQVTAENRACEGGNRFGFFIRAPESNQGYMAGFTCDGKYTFSLYDGKRSTELVPPTYDEAIYAGDGAQNHLGVMADGGVFDLYANGVHLARVEDDTYVAAGRFGFFVHPFSAQGFSIAYRDLEVWLGEGEGALEIAPTPDGSASDEDEVLVMATTDTVNVRSGPGNEYPSLGKAPEGTLVKVIGYSGDGRWAYVSLPPGVASGGIGWVNAAYLELVYEDGN